MQEWERSLLEEQRALDDKKIEFKKIMEDFKETGRQQAMSDHSGFASIMDKDGGPIPRLSGF